MITRMLSLVMALLLVATLLWNNQLVVAYSGSLSLTADAAEVMMHVETDSLATSHGPSFMQKQESGSKEIQSQLRLGYLLSRGN